MHFQEGLSPTHEMYLKVLYRLQLQNQVGRVRDMAKGLGVTPSTVSAVLKKLEHARFAHPRPIRDRQADAVRHPDSRVCCPPIRNHQGTPHPRHNLMKGCLTSGGMMPGGSGPRIGDSHEDETGSHSGGDRYASEV